MNRKPKVNKMQAQIKNEQLLLILSKLEKNVGSRR